MTIGKICNDLRTWPKIYIMLAALRISEGKRIYKYKSNEISEPLFTTHKPFIDRSLRNLSCPLKPTYFSPEQQVNTPALMIILSTRG